MSSPAGCLQLAQRVFHFGMVLYYAAVDINIVQGMEHAFEKLGRPKDDPMVNRMLEGSATYFTVWNLLIQQIYFFMCCTEYLLEFLPKAIPPTVQEQLRNVRRMVLPILLFPCACEVVFNFWTLYSYSPRLVFGDLLDVINPMWINHAIHTYIVPIAALELLIRARTEGVWDGGFHRDAFKMTALFSAYLVAVLVGHHRRGTWPYPFMDPMDDKQFWGMVSVCYIMGLTWFCLGKCLTRIFSVGMGAVRPNPAVSLMKTE